MKYLNQAGLNYQKRTIILIVVCTVLRVIFASRLELSSDEAYYWTYALKLQWNYFDHPPIVGWLIRATTADLSLRSEIFIRLGAIISSATCTWLFFKIGTLLKDVKTGWFAALLYSSSIYCSITAGTFILPDGPEMVFWLVGFWLLIKISRLPAEASETVFAWCFFGLVSGLCIMSKVNGVFLWTGAILYALAIDRSWLKYPGIYLAGAITLIVVSPIVIWNLQNDFAGYKFHSSRIILTGAGINVVRFVKELLSEIALTNPVNFFLILNSIFLILKGKLTVYKKDLQLLLLCCLPLIMVLSFISLFRETLPHWPGPAYSTLLFLPAIKLASYPNGKTKLFPNIVKAALIYLMVIAVLEVLLINHFPGTLSAQKQGNKMGSDDITLDMYGWQEVGEKFDSLYKSDIKNNIVSAGAPILITGWYPGAHLEFYVANKTRQQILGIGGILDLHQYYWSNRYKRSLKFGESAYYIVPSNLFTYKALIKVKSRFLYYELPLVIPQFRSGILCKEVYVFRMIGYKGKK